MANVKLLLFYVIGLYMTMSSTTANDTVAISQEFAKHNDNFSLKFYSELNKLPQQKYKNIIYSPLSIQTVGSLLYMGASGATSKELKKGFELFSDDKKSIASTYQQILDKYDNSPFMKIVNKIYLMTGNEIETEFNGIAKNNYHTSVENINFGKTDEAAKAINNWVVENTNGKIKDFVTENDVDADTKMFLVNAIHFKGEWAVKFDQEHTHEADFHLTPEKTTKVSMMSRTDTYKFGHISSLSAHSLEIPFKHGNMSLFILNPKAKDISVETIEKNLVGKNLQDIFKSMEEMKVVLSLPKFKIETTIDMQEILTKMGMGIMFGKDADFSNLLKSNEPLYVSKAIHKAFIEINEEGAEAAAATGVNISFRTSPFHFNCDRPFLYFIKGSQGEIYFMGKYTGEQ